MKMYSLSLQVIYIIVCLLLGLKEYQSYEVPCKEFEVIVCGDEDREWTVCTPKTYGVRRILTAQLDTRYRNRYCRKYGTPENFGLSSSGRSMWTVGWCYGTFFLCLEIDRTSTTTEDLSNVFGESSPERLNGETTPGYGFSSASSESIDDTNFNASEPDYIDEEFIVETGPLETEDYISNEEYFESDNMRQVDNDTLGIINQEFVYYELDPRMKIWLIFGIVGGGIIVVVFICAVAYLTIQCCDDTNPYDRSSSKSSKRESIKYFRPQKLSTSALVTSEPECVYDFIPAAKLTSSASFKMEHETRENQIDRQISEQTNKGNIHQHIIDKGATIYQTNSPQKPKENDYFILIPQAVDSERENENVVVYKHLQENIYDHLHSTRAVSVSDSSTYHSLTFERDESFEESDLTSLDEKNETISESDASTDQENENVKSEDSGIGEYVINNKEIDNQSDLNCLTDTEEIDHQSHMKCLTDTVPENITTKVDSKRSSYRTLRTSLLQTDV